MELDGCICRRLPISMSVSSEPSGVPGGEGHRLTGKVFSNNRARSRSLIREATSSMTFSMTSEVKVRHFGCGL